MKKNDKSRLPKGWTLEQVEKIRNHYESQTEDEAVAEDEAMFDKDPCALMTVPRKLVPRVKKMIAEHRGKAIKQRKTRRVA